MRKQVRVLASLVLALACFSSCGLIDGLTSGTHSSEEESVTSESSSVIEESSSEEESSKDNSSVVEETIDPFYVYESQDIPYYMNMSEKKMVLVLEEDVVFEEPYGITAHATSGYVEELVIEGNGHSITFLETKGVYQAISLTKPGAKIIVNDTTLINEKTGGTPSDRKIIYTSINATTVEFNDCFFDGPARFMNNVMCTNCVFENEDDTSGIDRYLIFFEPDDGNSYTVTLDSCTLSAPEGMYGLMKIHAQTPGLSLIVRDTTFAKNDTIRADVFVDVYAGAYMNITYEGTNVFSNDGVKALKTGTSSENVTVNGVAVSKATMFSATDLANLTK